LNPGNPINKFIPPTPRCVPAGSLVFKQGDEAREMFLIEEGELLAFDNKGNEERELFRMGKGSLVGVTSIFEHEPKPHSVKALTEVKLSVVDEACMASLLKVTPIWLLTIIKTIISRTRVAKQHTQVPLFSDPLESLSRFLFLRYGGKPLEMVEIVREYSWQTRVSEESIRGALRSLVRRNMINLVAGENGPDSRIIIEQPMLLDLFVNYLICEKTKRKYPPFQLTPREKSCLEFLNLEKAVLTKEGNDWLKYLQVANPEASVAEIIKFQELGILYRDRDPGRLKLQRIKLEHFLLAIHNEASIKGSCL